MAIFLVASRYKKRLRKLSSEMLPRSGEARATSLGEEAPVLLDARGSESDGVVRAGYSISRMNAEQIDSMLFRIRQATGKACSASEIVRIAIANMAQRPLQEVINLLETVERRKPGRRPR
jgi:hypothetical protein